MALTPQSFSPFVNDAPFCLILIKRKHRSGRMDAFLNNVIRKQAYLLFLLKSWIKQSSAMVIEGAFGFGACMSSLKPSFVTASAVVGPKAAIFISPCLNEGKFSFRDFIPEGL